MKPTPRPVMTTPVLINNIVLIDDHSIVRGLLQRIAEDAFPGVTVFAARDGRTGIDLTEQHQPELILLDLELPDADGFELVGQLRTAAPRARVLVLSSHTEPYVLHRIIEAAVDGFVDKNEHDPALLVGVMRQVADGQRYFSAVVQDALARFRSDPTAFPKLLSPREQDLLRLFGQGWSDQRIAEQVGLRDITVRNHRRNIMARLGIHSTPELIRYALENGFTRIRAAGALLKPNEPVSS